LAAALALGLVGTGLAGGAGADRGDGAVPDRLDRKAEAFRTWLPQALRGNAHAQFELGAAFVTGRSEPEDFAEAARWLKKSAEQGNPRAQNGLGILYSKGLGVPRDFLEAYIWFDLAAERFEHGLRREQALELREMVRALMTPEQVIEAGREIEARKAGWE
jgi:TPR repeat protein